MDTSTLMAAIAVMKNMPDNAAASAAAAAESAEAAQEVLNNIPQDYTELSDDVSNLRSAVEELEAGSLSALDASVGQVPTANGDGTWDWSSDKVDKSSLDNAGITAKTYTTLMEETVATVADGEHLNPYALANTTFGCDKRYLYRVTVNGNEYILPCSLWWEKVNSNTVKVYEYIGNLGLYIADTSGVPHNIPNVPFVIINDMVNSNSIEILTSPAGQYLIKIEKIQNTQRVIPNSLIYGDNYYPVEHFSNGGSTYDGMSIGVNSLTSNRGTIALGFGNTCSADFAIAIGFLCTASGINCAHAEGMGTTASGESSHAEGAKSQATKAYSHAEGQSTKATGQASHSEGTSCQATGAGSHAEGGGTVASGNYAHAEGVQSTASGASSHAEGSGTIANHKAQHVFGNYNIADPSSAAETATGTYVEIVGNGTSSARSNARTLDWSGNEELAGSITLGKGTTDEVTLSAAQLKQLLALLN